MKINAQTPFEVLEDGKARFFVGGEWSAPIDLPEFLKLPNFLRLKEWEFDTDTGKIRVYQGERQWSAPFDPPAVGGGGGGSTPTPITFTPSNATLTESSSAGVQQVGKQVICNLRLRYGDWNLIPTIGGGRRDLGSLPAGAQPQGIIIVPAFVGNDPNLGTVSIGAGNLTLKVAANPPVLTGGYINFSATWIVP